MEFVKDYAGFFSLGIFIIAFGGVCFKIFTFYVKSIISPIELKVDTVSDKITSHMEQNHYITQMLTFQILNANNRIDQLLSDRKYN